MFFDCMSKLPSDKYWNRTKNKSVHIWICLVPWCSGLWVSCLQINTEKVKKKNKSVHVPMDLYGSLMFRFMSELPSNKYWNSTKNKSVHVQMDLYGSFMFRFTSELPSNKFKRFLLFLACYTSFWNLKIKVYNCFRFHFLWKKNVYFWGENSTKILECIFILLPQ